MAGVSYEGSVVVRSVERDGGLQERIDAVTEWDLLRWLDGRSLDLPAFIVCSKTECILTRYFVEVFGLVEVRVLPFACWDNGYGFVRVGDEHYQLPKHLQRLARSFDSIHRTYRMRDSMVSVVLAEGARRWLRDRLAASALAAAVAE